MIKLFEIPEIPVFKTPDISLKIDFLSPGYIDNMSTIFNTGIYRQEYIFLNFLTFFLGTLVLGPNAKKGLPIDTCYIFVMVFPFGESSLKDKIDQNFFSLINDI
jgi:hypothetical protein